MALTFATSTWKFEENPNTANLHFFLTFNTTESFQVAWRQVKATLTPRDLSSVHKGFKSLRGGGEYLSANVTVGRKMLVYSLSWSKPYFMDTPWTVGIEGNDVR